MSADLAAAIVAALDDAALDALAERLAARLLPRLRDQPGAPADEWLDTKRAAAYLGLSVTAVHKMTSARTIPFEQDGPGCKCWFRRSELDAWRRGTASASKTIPSRPIHRESHDQLATQNPT